MKRKYAFPKSSEQKFRRIMKERGVQDVEGVLQAISDGWAKATTKLDYWKMLHELGIDFTLINEKRQAMTIYPGDVQWR